MVRLPEEDLGAELELSFQAETLTKKVVRAVDPPLLTGFDRKPRVEGYVKFSEPMDLGRIHLSKGKGELRLQANKIPGDQALEFRLLMFRRSGSEKELSCLLGFLQG